MPQTDPRAGIEARELELGLLLNFGPFMVALGGICVVLQNTLLDLVIVALKPTLG